MSFTATPKPQNPVLSLDGVINVTHTIKLFWFMRTKTNKIKKTTDMGCSASAVIDPYSYPPEGLSLGIKKLPEWIQAGCGNKEYYCEEK